MMKTAISVLVLAALLYFFFMVPLGQKTLWQHTQSIAGTSEAKQLGQEIGVASKKIGKKIEHQLKEIQKEEAETKNNAKGDNLRD